jgi:hypothetical protein
LNGKRIAYEDSAGNGYNEGDRIVAIFPSDSMTQ